MRLLPRSEEIASIIIEKLPKTTLSEFIGMLSDLNRDGLIPGNLHISNRNRRLSVVTPLYAKHREITIGEAKKKIEKEISGEWSASLSMRGNTASINSYLKTLQNRLHGRTKISSFLASNLERTQNSREILAATRGTFLHAKGIPSDDAIYSLGYAQSELLTSDPIQSNSGTLFVVPVLPFESRDFAHVVRCVERTFKKFRFAPFMTFNLVERNNLEGVINLTFNRTDQARIDASHRCVLETFESLMDAGYPPQRTSIFQMPYLKKHAHMMDQGYIQTVRDLKKMFDPDNIITRGRYEFA
jgi:hypothetical protein